MPQALHCVAEPAGQSEGAQILIRAEAEITGGDDESTADAVTRLARAAEWSTAFDLACRRSAGREPGARTRAAAVRAIEAAAASPALSSALDDLLRTGGHGPILLGLVAIAAAAGGRSPDLSRAPGRAWEAGVFPWLDACDADLTARTMALLRPVLRPNSLAGELAEVLAHMPAAAPGGRFRDEPWTEMQLVRATGGASRLLVCFAGARGGIGLPCNLFHRWAAHSTAHVLYLRDLVHQDFRRGVAAAGSGWEDLVRAIDGLARSLGADRIACWGNSGGGLPAARLALTIGAPRAVVLAGVATARVAARAEQPDEDASAAMAREVRRLAAGARTRILWLFARDHQRDAADARAMADVPAIAVKPVPTGRHNIAAHLARSGALASAFDWVNGIGSARP